MARKGENIHKRKDGRWEGRYIKSRSAEGTAVYGYVYGKSYAEAKRAKLTAEAAGQDQAPAFYLADFCGVWLAHMQATVKESTYVKYRRICESYILPYFALPFNAPVSSTDTEGFSDYLLHCGGKRQNPLAPKTTADILLVLQELLAYCGSHTSLKSTAKITLPRQNRQNSATLSTWEQAALAKHLKSKNDFVSAGILVSMYTGLRIGELCALRWEDIDLNNRQIKIERSVTRIQNIDRSAAQKTKLVIDSPKTRNSERMIPLSQPLIPFLSAKEQEGKAYILTGTTQLMEPRRFYARYKKIISACNLEGYTFHALRHTFATRCIESGVDIKSLSEVLGHADVRITLNRYVHPSLETKRRELEKLPHF